MALTVILRSFTRNPVYNHTLKVAALKIEPRKWHTQYSTGFSLSKFTKLPLSVAKFDSHLKRSMSANHAKVWPLEKLVTVSLLGLVPATFMLENAIVDDLFAIAMCLHMHWGLENCAVDYIRPVIFGSIIPKLAILLLYCVTLTTLASLVYYNHTDIGIGCTFKKFWQVSGSLDD